MRSKANQRFPTHHGYGEIGLSRFFMLYVAQAVWLGLGVYLLLHAYWPSTCTPHNPIEVYACSMRLPENGGWREAALLTWLWATPILIALEISRRMRRDEA
ncbi:hypothetical protein GRI62_00480 [Erythrobacter arachoides]|uniref:Uncharacterized protein n=1 Tax=Aurantiacibacter arachoides TaxID=1850444 RepID=A0A844ZUT2_9SPHN|nr:hypothetical protein [Aurantiacibacter arachoides]MXO92081.1 hypothetical protein [Aurantiacibacter arachoides]GGD59943.1 hypothetical protein GCM10011411_20090 [Aurantiacibacter arachoides]